MSYQPTDKTVYVVQIQGSPPDVWDNGKNAYEAAYHSVIEMMSDEDEERFKAEEGMDFSSASDEDVIEWWNKNNPNCLVSVSEHWILTIK